MAALAHDNLAEPLNVILVFARIELQLVHLFQIERNAPLAAVDFKPVVIAPPGCKSRGFKRAERAIGKSRQKQGGIIHSHAAHCVAGLRAQPRVDRFECGTFFDKRGIRADHAVDIPYEVQREVDDMRVQIPVRPGPGLVFFQPPDQREIRIDDPVLQIHGAPVVNFSNPPFGDQLLRQSHRGHAPIVERHHRLFRRVRGHGQQFSGFFKGVCQRLFANHMLARLQRGQCHGQVQVAGRANVDDVDVVSGDDLFPVGLPFLPTVRLGRVLHRVSVAPADHFQHGFHVEFGKKRGHLSKPIAVRLAHKRIPDHADIEFHNTSSFEIQMVVDIPEKIQRWSRLR